MSELSWEEKMRVAAWVSEYAQQGDDFIVFEEDLEDGDGSDFSDYDEDVQGDFAAAAADGVVSADVADEAPSQTYDTFDALYAAVAPKRGAQKAATAAWWLEQNNGQQTWTAFEANKLLKSIDVKVSSISIVLSNAVKAKDPLMEEVSRGGDSDRSRKVFSLTDAGRAYVEAQLA